MDGHLHECLVRLFTFSPLYSGDLSLTELLLCVCYNPVIICMFQGNNGNTREICEKRQS